jgi:hypothetical protein
MYKPLDYFNMFLGLANLFFYAINGSVMNLIVGVICLGIGLRGSRK